MKEKLIQSYLKTSSSLVNQYLELKDHVRSPLNNFLKNYFKTNSKYGKRDRKVISDFVFAYFKLGRSFDIYQIENRILISAYLSSKHEEDFFTLLTSNSDLGKPEYADFKGRLTAVQNKFNSFSLNHFLPFEIQFTEGMNIESYFSSFYSPSYFFIRVINKYMNEVINELSDKQISHQLINELPNCIRFEKQVQLQELKTWQKGYFEIQDISSQAVANYFNPKKHDFCWDMCAASGGKSLLLLSKESQLNLLCSDSRNSILKNLRDRFNRFAYKVETEVMDLTLPIKLNQSFNGIICDAPCSGSATWKRNPEELFFFTPQKLEYYTLLQKQILENGINNSKVDTSFFYITCSVFANENEEQLKKYSNDFKNKNFLNYFNSGGNALFISTK
jgi:16S rRNA (cytosine967-C5)-methyltransferase